MYHHRDSVAADVGSGIAMMGVTLGIVLLLLVAFLIVAAVVFIVKTFVEHNTHKSLWIALVVCVVLCLAGGLICSVYQSGLLLVGVGIAELLLTCLVVSLRNRTTLMREQVSLVDQVLHTPWWGAEDRPRDILYP